MSNEPDRQHYNLTFAILAIGAISFSLLQSLVVPALPEIQKALHSSETSVAWVLTAYLLSASVGTPIAGRLGDMYGKERVLVIVLGVLAIGTLVSAVANSMGLLIAGRVIQGAGGGIFPLAFGIIRDEFPRDRVAGGIGLMSSLLGIGGGLGVVLAGPIVQNLSFHWLFWFPLITTLIATVATLLYVPESPIKVPGGINWLAGLLMSMGLVAILIAVSETITWGWGSAKTIGLIAAGTLVLGGWVWTEVRSKVPLVDMAMMRIRGVWTTNVVAFLLGVGMYSSFILIPQFVQEPKSTGYGFGASVVASGLYLLPSTLAMVVVGQFAGRLEKRFGSRIPLIAGGAFAAASFLMLTIARAHGWEVLVATLLLGIGIGLAFAAMANLIVDNVEQEQTGVATGINTVMRTLGGALGGQIAATFLAQDVIAHQPTNHAYTLAFALCTGSMVVGIGAGLLIPARGRARGAAGAATPTSRPESAPSAR
jgi:EmrB/QacA subfamily drug resistance transporter